MAGKPNIHKYFATVNWFWAFVLTLWLSITSNLFDLLCQMYMTFFILWIQQDWLSITSNLLDLLCQMYDFFHSVESTRLVKHHI